MNSGSTVEMPAHSTCGTKMHWQPRSQLIIGPPAGVPFSVKSNIDVAGSATTWGVAPLNEQIAIEDAPVVARLREAGAIRLPAPTSRTSPSRGTRRSMQPAERSTHGMPPAPRAGGRASALAATRSRSLAATVAERSEAPTIVTCSERGPRSGA